jgi:hypothetical protein
MEKQLHDRPRSGRPAIHQPRHAAALRWHSCESANNKSATGRTAFSQQWKRKGKYWRFRIFEDMRKMSSSKSHNRAQTSKESNLFSTVGAFWCLRGGLFVRDRHRWRNLGSPLNRRRKDNQWSGIIRNHNEQRSSTKQLPSERSWSPSFGSDGVILVDVMARGETINSDAYIKPSKNWNSVTGKCGLTGIQEACWFSTIPALTQYVPKRQSPKFGRTELHHTLYCHDLAPSNFHPFRPLKGSFRGTRFEDESVIRAVRTCLREKETSWFREGMYALVSEWRKDVDRLRLRGKTNVILYYLYYTMREFHTFWIVFDNKKWGINFYILYYAWISCILNSFR